jgi:hypothetical protein
VPADPAHRGLLPDRPRPAGLPDPRGPTAPTGAAPWRRHRQPAAHGSGRSQGRGAGRGGCRICRAGAAYPGQHAGTCQRPARDACTTSRTGRRARRCSLDRPDTPTRATAVPDGAAYRRPARGLRDSARISCSCGHRLNQPIESPPRRCAALAHGLPEGRHRHACPRMEDPICDNCPASSPHPCGRTQPREPITAYLCERIGQAAQSGLGACSGTSPTPSSASAPRPSRCRTATSAAGCPAAPACRPTPTRCPLGPETMTGPVPDLVDMGALQRAMRSPGDQRIVDLSLY